VAPKIYQMPKFIVVFYCIPPLWAEDIGLRDLAKSSIIIPEDHRPIICAIFELHDVTEIYQRSCIPCKDAKTDGVRNTYM